LNTEAELYAANLASHDALFIVRLEEELLKIILRPVLMYEDNQAAFQHCTSHVRKSRLKHLELNMFKLKENTNKGLFKLLHIDTEEQLADLLTKPLDSPKFAPFCRHLLFTESY